MSPEEQITFMPLEAVWADDRLDTSRLRPKAEVATGYVRFRDGDVLCPKVTPTFQAGRSAIVNGIEPGVGAATTEVHVVRARPGIADARFLRYRLMAQDFLGLGVANFQGVAGLQRVPDDFVRDLPVAALPLEQQRRIADLLDDQVARIDALIVARRQQIEVIAEWRSASLAELFAAGASRKLQTLLVARPSYGVLVPKFVNDSGVSFVRVGDINALSDPGHSLAQIDPNQSCEYVRTVVAAGDLLVSVVGSVDKSAVVPEWRAGCNVARAVARLRPASADVAWSLHAWMQTPLYLDQARLSTQGDTAQPTLNMGDLSQFTVKLDDPSAVAVKSREIVGDAQRREEFCSRSIALMHEYKRSLIAAAVTGELDVTTARSAVPA